METNTKKVPTVKKNLGSTVNSVLKTRDLKQFKFRKDNRLIIQSHVKALAKSMSEDGWLAGSYVVVNSSMDVIDGQHRILAAILAKVPILYVMEETSGFNTIRGLNRLQKNWSIIAHIHGFVAENNPHYVALQNLMDDYPKLRPTECMILCLNTFTGVRRSEFDSGQFKVKDMVLARQWADNIMSLQPYFDGYNKSIFVRALVKVMSKQPIFEFESFLYKVKLRPLSIHMCGTVEQYVQMIEDIYNYKRITSNKLNLRF